VYNRRVKPSVERPPAVAAAFLATLALALYLPGLGAEILRHPLEAKYALVAREMLAGGPWLVPHVYGELFADKPPLHFWLTAALGWLWGGRIDEVTARLPAVAAAVAGVLLIHRLGRDLFGSRAGFLAAAVLATGNLFFWYARQGHLDQLLTTFVTLACLGLWRGLTAPTARRATTWMAVGYAAMGLAVLAKGLIGLAVPLLAVTGYLALTGPIRALPARLRLDVGAPVFLGVVLAWFAPAVARYGLGYFYEALVRQHFVRYADTWAHAKPLFYYFGEFPAGFFPWVVFLPGALALAWRSGREADATMPAARAPLFPLVWFSAGFVFFSLASGKRGAYLLPLYPAAALLVGWLVDRVLSGRADRRWIGVPLTLVCAAAALIGLALAVIPRETIVRGGRSHTVPSLWPADLHLALGGAAVLLAAAAILFGAWRARRATLALGVLVALQSAVLLSAATLRAARYEEDFPARAFAARIQAAVPPGEPVLSLAGDYDNIVAFYLDRRLQPVGAREARVAVGRAGSPVFLLVGPDGWPLDGAAQPVAEAAFEGQPLRLLRLDRPAG
jgi:4-amino-4-deoxy-L-arabinose transferase-like glycosyltransferase